MSRRQRLSERDIRAAIAQKGGQRERWLKGAHLPTGKVRSAVVRAGAQVHGMGVGRKIVAGKATNSTCIRFYVTHKLPKALISDEQTIPTHIDGVPTDVIEAPVAYFANSAPPTCSTERLSRQRPICPGISGANSAHLAGTLGAICRSTIIGEEADRYLLGCSHVLQDQTTGAQNSTRILQPSSGDGGVAGDEIGRFVRSAPILQTADASNKVDAAIALLADGIEAITEICRVGKPLGTAAVLHSMTVHKHGRTSGYTTGSIDDPSIDVLVPESEASGATPARFVSQFRVIPTAGMSLFAQSGDSGALVVERKSQNAVGLLFACPRDNSYAYCNPISEVLLALQISLELDS